MSKPFLHPEISDRTLTPLSKGRWMVMIFDNDHTRIDEVVDVLMRATMCSHEEAVIETWEAHTYGKAPVHFSNRRDCVEVASVIQKVGVKTEVRPEWED